MHPVARAAELEGLPRPVPEECRFPDESDLRANAKLTGPFAMLLPHPCDFAEGEKGETHPFRLVAPVEPWSDHRHLSVKLLRRGQVVHAVWVPGWDAESTEEDWLVDLRRMTALDQAFLGRNRRVASLSSAAWLAVVDRVSRFFTGTPINESSFALSHAHLHPDAPG